MKYKLTAGNTTVPIKKHNVEAHVDIEKDIKDRNTGQFTFTLRINDGNIVDYNVTEYVDIPQKYFQPKVTYREHTVSYVSRK